MTKLYITARGAASMLRMLRLLTDLAADARPDAARQCLYEGSFEAAAALDRLADCLPAGEARNEADWQCWEVSPNPPDAATLERWAAAWDAIAKSVAA